MNAALNESTQVRDNGQAPARPAARLVGESPAMKSMHRLIERVAPTEASVLITGESGSGKELVAARIHSLSERAAGPFIAINCGAIPAGLIEAELFGYEKGSFTGAGRSHAGVFERAEGGTLFLDEVTEMPPDMQTRLLRVLETKTLYRVGGSTQIATNVRVIAATNRCPATAVRDGQLREDILYRLAVFPVAVPPLRERGEDVLLIADHFLEELNLAAGTDKRFSEASRASLTAHRWPGNVRELRNSVERAFILADGTLELEPLLLAAQTEAAPAAPVDRTRLEIRVGSRIDDVERSLIEATLAYFEGNKRRAAETLGCSLKTLYNKLNSYCRKPDFANS